MRKTQDLKTSADIQDISLVSSRQQQFGGVSRKPLSCPNSVSGPSSGSSACGVKSDWIICVRTSLVVGFYLWQPIAKLWETKATIFSYGFGNPKTFSDIILHMSEDTPGLTRDDTHTQKKDATHEKEERHTGQNTTYWCQGCALVCRIFVHQHVIW